MVRKFYTYFFNGPLHYRLLDEFQVCGSIGFFQFFFTFSSGTAEPVLIYIYFY